MNLRERVEQEIEVSRKKIFLTGDKWASADKSGIVAMDAVRQQCWRITTLQEVLEWIESKP